MEIIPVVAEAVMTVVMKPAEVMHIAEMAARPMSGVEMMACAAGRKMASAERMRRRMHRG